MIRVFAGLLFKGILHVGIYGLRTMFTQTRLAGQELYQLDALTFIPQQHDK